jgi:hypothetical protein
MGCKKWGKPSHQEKKAADFQEKSAALVIVRLEEMG